MEDQRHKELQWYKKHGKYKDRVTTDSVGQPYVIGDWAWNRMHPYNYEHIEEKMGIDD